VLLAAVEGVEGNRTRLCIVQASQIVAGSVRCELRRLVMPTGKTTAKYENVVLSSADNN